LKKLPKKKIDKKKETKEIGTDQQKKYPVHQSETASKRAHQNLMPDRISYQKRV
jgi:hypothetical protein